jgi:sulfofructose kinase
MSKDPAIFDVLGLGCVAIDDLLYVPTYPEPDSKLRLTRRERQGGGLTGTALVAASRLGSRCAYAGQLGPDDFSACAEGIFRREGVDVSHAPRLPDARVIQSTIVVAEDTASRTILYLVEGRVGAHETLPSEEIIRASKVLFIDHYGVVGGLRAAKIARAAGRAVVADFETRQPGTLGEVVDWVDHLIVSQSFAERATGLRSPVEAARAFWRSDREVVIVTCGESGSWVLSKDQPETPRHHPAFVVPVVDTTGCGDVFHGAYAAALASGAALDKRLRFASAAAAIKAGRRGGQAGAPDRAAVDRFLADPPPTHSKTEETP